MNTDFARFAKTFFAALAVIAALSAAVVMPKRRAATPEQLRYFVPQADPLFRAEMFGSLLDAAELVVFGTSRAETGFNPSLYQTLARRPALNLGTAGASLAGSSPVAAEVLDRWGAHARGREVLYVLTQDELTNVEEKLGRYACFGLRCFELWRGAPLAEIWKQEAAWVERAARLKVGWDLRALGQSLLSWMGRPRTTLSEARCAAFGDLTVEEAAKIAPQTYCARGFTVNPPVAAPRELGVLEIPPWNETLARPMSGMAVLMRQVAMLAQAGVRVTIVYYDTTNRPVTKEGLAALRDAVPGAEICHFRPGTNGYYDSEHLSLLAASQVTRFIATRAPDAAFQCTPASSR